MTKQVEQEEAPWVPPGLFAKQQRLFNMGTADDAGKLHPNSPTAILVSGPRYSSKSFGCDHRMIRHLWETPGARVAIINKTLRNTTDSGTQQRLTEYVIPVWLDANIGLHYVTRDGDGIPGFKTDGRTRTPFCRISNAHGGESEIRILSVEHDCEIEQKLKDSFWSAIRLIELANFKDPKIFTVSWEQLRMPHLRPWQHMFLADTNPAIEGEDSWIFKFWYKRDWSAVTLAGSENNKAQGEEIKRCREKFEKSLRLLEIFLEDNQGLSDDQIEDRKALHSGDPGEYARDVEGKWVSGSGGANRIFADVFSREIHVIEEDPEKGEKVELSSTTSDLFSGSDIGGSINHGFAIAEKRIVRLNDVEWPVWLFLREIESIGERIKISDLGTEMLRLITELEKLYGRKFGWTHYADDTALTVFRPSGKHDFDHLEILASTHGAIQMTGVKKPSGSVLTRQRLLRRLIREKRCFISSQCPRLIAAIENAATDKNGEVTGIHRHILDAASYILLMESSQELAEIAFRPQVGTAPPALVSMRL